MDEECEITLTSSNSTKYNLCPLKLLPLSQIKYYQVLDIRSNKYFGFNILSPTLDAPLSVCDSNPNSFAYLYDSNNTQCLSLSGQAPVISLLNDHNPSQGIVISYQSNHTSSACGNRGKRLNLRFVCDNEAIVDIPNTIISEIDYVGDEPDNIDNQCQYNLTFNSVYGCPHSCPIYNKKVCNNYGLCGYDATERHEPRCYCYTSVGGIACEILEEEHHVFTPSDTAWSMRNAYDLSLETVHQFTINKTAFDGTVYAMNITYDLEIFKNIFKVVDLDGAMYNYYFLRVPDQYAHICPDNNHGTVFQIDEENRKCVIAGGSKLHFSLYDTSNAAKGVSISLNGGDYCEKDGTLRSFKVNIICPDDGNTYYTPNQTIYSFVEEDSWDTCSYHMDIVSAYGCPRECITRVNGTGDGANVCSTHGMCIADVFSGYVHCECDGPPHWIWTGDYCEMENHNEPPNVHSNDGDDEVKNTNRLYLVALISVCVIFALFCLVLACGFLLFRRRKQRAALHTSSAIPYEEAMLDDT
eukprot:168905_1